MQALIYHGPGQKQWESKSDPKIEDPTDAIVKIDTTTICGTDLHILKGDVPTVDEGRTLGHEAVGTVLETGSSWFSVKGLGMMADESEIQSLAEVSHAQPHHLAKP